MFFAAVDIPILEDIVIIFSLSVFVIYVFNKLKIPPIVGFLLTGVLVGPHALGLIDSGKEVEILAEIGVILILFSIGLEFSLSKLLKIKKNILVGGSAQVLITILIGFVLALQLGVYLNQAIFVGFLAALSSTAIILNLHQSNSSLESPHGRITLSILIYQDIIILPMFLLVPILSGKSGDLTTSVIFLFAKIIGILLVLWLGIKYVMPFIMYQIAKTRIKELFIISILVICLGIVYLAGLTGISLALGAFIAGLIISETEYSDEALGFVEPFRDVFSSFFFVSIGMLLNINFFIENIGFISVLVLSIVLIKFATGTLATLFLSYPLRIAIISGMILAQIGEFSFVLAVVGVKEGLLTQSNYQLFLAVAVITMIATPFIFRGTKFINILFSKSKWLKSLDKPDFEITENQNLENHIVIVGYGLNGRNLSKAAEFAGLSFIALEMNPVTVREERKKGIPIFYGDATNEAVLHNACVENAKVAVIAISDPTAVRAIAYNIKRLNPKIHLIVRTRYLNEVNPLFKNGADEVVPEEFETSVEIFTRVLNKYLIPKADIEKFTIEMRSGCYHMLRSNSSDKYMHDLQSMIPDYEITTLKVSNTSKAKGKSLLELKLRERHQITMLGIKRGEEIIVNPAGDTNLKGDDLIILFGKPEHLLSVNQIFKN